MNTRMAVISFLAHFNLHVACVMFHNSSIVVVMALKHFTFYFVMLPWNWGVRLHHILSYWAGVEVVLEGLHCIRQWSWYVMKIERAKRSSPYAWNMTSPDDRWCTCNRTFLLQIIFWPPIIFFTTQAMKLAIRVHCSIHSVCPHTCKQKTLHGKLQVIHISVE